MYAGNFVECMFVFCVYLRVCIVLVNLGVSDAPKLVYLNRESVDLGVSELCGHWSVSVFGGWCLCSFLFLCPACLSEFLSP